MDKANLMIATKWSFRSVLDRLAREAYAAMQQSLIQLLAHRKRCRGGTQ
jgi:hypothetical protein